MNEDKRYYGVYEGICVDSDDPEDAGRIRLRVPQVTGQEVTSWARSLGGTINAQFIPYGVFSDLTSQYQGGGSTSPGTANTATPAKHSITEDANGVYVDPAHTSRIYVEETGDYLLTFSGQFAKSGSNAEQADMWVRKNGIDLPRTNSRITLQGNPNEMLISLAFNLDLESGDYIEVVFSSASATLHLVAHTGLSTPTRPDIPSIITSLTLVAKRKPRPQTKVWVMYIAGDPNFPVWIGSQ